MARTEKQRAVAYCRLSKDTAGSGEGVERQEADAREVVKRRGFKLVSVYTDNDFSAAGKKTRPRFEAMLRAVEAGQVEVVIAWSWDRLARNRRDTVRLMETCEAAKVTIVLVRGNDMDLSTPAGRFAADMLAGVARNEIDVKSDRQRSAARQAAEAGKLPYQRAFGYQQDGTIDEYEAEAVREVFSRYLAGSTFANLVHWLNDNGYRTTKGKPWTHSSVLVLLGSPRYAGQRRYRPVDGEESTFEGNWEPIVESDTFEAAEAELGKRKQRRPARKHLGGGLFRCYSCGVYLRTGRSQHNTRIYRCPAYHLSRSAEAIDTYVRGVLVERLSRPDVGELLAVKADPAVTRKLRDEAMGLRQRRGALGDDYAEGLLTGEQVRRATDRIKARLAEVEHRLAELDGGPARALAGAADPAETWLNLPLAEQRAVLDALATVTVLRGSPGKAPFDPDTVEVKWRRDGAPADSVSGEPREHRR